MPIHLPWGLCISRTRDALSHMPPLTFAQNGTEVTSCDRGLALCLLSTSLQPEV